MVQSLLVGCLEDEDFRDGEPRLTQLFWLIAGLLCIPSSNTDAERGFSFLKVHTDERASSSHSTIVGLISLKFKKVLLF